MDTKKKENSQGEIIIYQTDDGVTKIDVRFVDETVWLTQAQLAELYQSSKANVSEHIKHIFEEGELDENSVVRKFRTTASDGKNLLADAGKVSHAMAMEKAKREYQKYIVQNLSPVEDAYLQTIREVQRKAKGSVKERNFE